jgi:hypothetical protein
MYIQNYNVYSDKKQNFPLIKIYKVLNLKEPFIISKPERYLI